MINAEVIAGTLSADQAKALLTTTLGSQDASGNFTGGLLSSATDWIFGEASNALSGSGGGNSYAGTPYHDPNAYHNNQNVSDYQDVATGIDLSNYNVLDDANYS
jgi:hypothetical protein